MIKELKLKNFMKHEQLHLKFTEGLNVIYGESNAGKTTIFNAIELALNNEGSEKDYLSYDTNFLIEIKIKDNVIKRTKRKYQINDIELKAFNNNLPEEITSIIHLKDINWQRQWDSYFLIQDSGGQTAKLFKKIIGNEEEEHLIKIVKNKIYKKKIEIKGCLNEKEKYEKFLIKYKDIPRLYYKLSFILRKKDKIKEYKENIKEFIFLINKYKELKSIDISKYKISLDYLLKIFKIILNKKEQIYKLELLLKQFNDLHNINISENLWDTLGELFGLQKQKQMIQETLINLKNLKAKYAEIPNLSEEISNEKQIFETALMKYELCPLCQTPLKKVTHENNIIRGLSHIRKKSFMQKR